MESRTEDRDPRSCRSSPATGRDRLAVRCWYVIVVTAAHDSSSRRDSSLDVPVSTCRTGRRRFSRPSMCATTTTSRATSWPSHGRPMRPTKSSRRRLPGRSEHRHGRRNRTTPCHGCSRLPDGSLPTAGGAPDDGSQSLSDDRSMTSLPSRSSGPGSTGRTDPARNRQPRAVRPREALPGPGGGGLLRPAGPRRADPRCRRPRLRAQEQPDRGTLAGRLRSLPLLVAVDREDFEGPRDGAPTQ